MYNKEGLYISINVIVILITIFSKSCLHFNKYLLNTPYVFTLQGAVYSENESKVSDQTGTSHSPT